MKLTKKEELELEFHRKLTKEEELEINKYKLLLSHDCHEVRYYARMHLVCLRSGEPIFPRKFLHQKKEGTPIEDLILILVTLVALLIFVSPFIVFYLLLF